MKTTQKDITKVVFRKYSDGEIIALFPQIICTNGGEILSYMHVGQHGAAGVDSLQICDFLRVSGSYLKENFTTV